MFYEFTAGGNTYQLRLNTRAIVSLEKKLGCNPLLIFGTDGTRIPTITEMVQILAAALTQFNHSVSEADAYDIYDRWISDGNAVTDFVSIIVEIYKVSGLIKDGTEKN